jgi:tricorn protease
MSHAVDDAGTRLLRQPALSKDHLAFVYGGDIWVSDRDGGRPLRITTHPAPEFAPHFSPDGRWIAFSATYDGNTDVYVVPTEGGQPRRLTWHPSADVVTGWSADGKRVLFVSSREVDNSRSGQLYEVSIDGGYEKKVMKAVAVEGSWSADGKRLAYRPYLMAYSYGSGWRQHRGGDTPPIWIIDPSAKTLEKIPHVNASDSDPMWMGEDVAFISDRNDGAANLYLYDGRTHAVRQLTHETTWDVRNAGAYEHTIVYEVGGQLKSIDVGSGQVTPLVIHLAVQSIQARPQWKDASHAITAARLSPTGKRVLITARGDIFSVPVKDGSTRNLTATSGIRESDALWSKDGQRVAYLSDEGGTQALLVRDAAALEQPVRHVLGKMGYFTLLDWSPDMHRIVFQDNHLHIYAIDLASNTVTLLDTSPRRLQFKASFSPDSQWLAYTVVAANTFTQVRLHSFASGSNSDLTERFVQTDNPRFAAGGLLYFTASIDAGPSRVGLDMSTQERPLRAGIYAAVLGVDGHSPLQPKTGDEELKSSEDKDATGKSPAKGGKTDKADKAAPAEKPMRIDLAGLSDRFVPIPVPERDYSALMVASDGALLYLALRQPGVETDPPSPTRAANAELYRFNFDERTEKLLRSGLSDVSMSRDGKKLLLSEGDAKFDVADAGEKLEAKSLDISGLRMFVDVRQEWQQIFDEVWRMEQQFFYDPNMHGLKWADIRARYEPLLTFVQRREDLNELLVEMIGEMQVGHNRIGGGDVYAAPPVGTGLLGADYRVENNQYRIAKIYHGDRWNPFLVAPLGVPGIDVAEGDAILAINGKPLDGSMNIFALLEGTAEKQVSLTVSREGKPARTVVVIPVRNESALRQWA